jgi:serine/threonine-protein kinase HipA
MANERCLCCGELLSDGPSDQGWHQHCIEKFFDSSTLPEIDLSQKILKEYALKSVRKGIAVPGVQKKMSLSLEKFSHRVSRLTLTDFPAGYILKPQTEDYPSLPEAEQLVMTLADASKISTCPHALIRLKDGSLAYLTRRIDRVFSKQDVVRIPMEDCCQLSGRLTEDKYRGSYEQIASLIRRYSSQSLFDLTELYYRLLFCFVTGNSDMHLKNFSLIQVDKNLFSLSPAYDLLPVNILMPEDKEETALTLQGKKSHLTRHDFIAFAQNIGLSEKVAIDLIASIVSLQETYGKKVEESFLPLALKQKMILLIQQRSSRLLPKA